MVPQNGLSGVVFFAWNRGSKQRMPKPCMAVAALVAVAMGLSGVSANADTVETKFARLVKSGSTISVDNDYILISKWSAIGIAAYAVVSLILIVFLAISWFRHYNLSLHLVSTIGLTALAAPSMLNAFLPQLGFVSYDGSLNWASALVGSAAIGGIVVIHWKNIDHKSKANPAPSPIQPLAGAVAETEPSGLPSESLTQLMVEKLVEDGMPSADAVAKYIINAVEKIEGEVLFDGLPEKLRNNVCNIVINEHPENTVVQSLRDAAPDGVPFQRAVAKRLLSLCRISSSNKMHTFIGKVDLFRTQLDVYRDRARRNE